MTKEQKIIDILTRLLEEQQKTNLYLYNMDCSFREFTEAVKSMIHEQKSGGTHHSAGETPPHEKPSVFVVDDAFGEY